MEDDSMDISALQGKAVDTTDRPIDAEIDASLAAIAKSLVPDRENDVLSRQEQEALELYHQLKELELEQAILEAESEVDDGMYTSSRFACKTHSGCRDVRD